MLSRCHRQGVDLTGDLGMAEDIGLDYLFWMGKWKGFGGETGFWEKSLEPMTLVSAIAACTTRLNLFATINPLLFHPAVAAKIAATIDDVSGGRFGFNVVTGNTLDEYEQMGVVPEGYNEQRYDYAEEWTTVQQDVTQKEAMAKKARPVRVDAGRRRNVDWDLKDRKGPPPMTTGRHRLVVAYFDENGGRLGEVFHEFVIADCSY